jgi:hypothetical protein
VQATRPPVVEGASPRAGSTCCRTHRLPLCLPEFHP